MQRELLIEALERQIKQLRQGCTNNGCVIHPERRGMGTNAICQCDPKSTAKNLRWLANELDNMNRNWTEKDKNHGKIEKT